ncbi:MAG: response regulator [Mitsuaria chitosanitabida]|nr:response regulator [Roseateles chitosanitabidus]MBO9687775.1 response regulator [Roseateles chitosanitabidus]
MPLSALFDGYATPDAAERASILIVDDLPEKLLVFETILADLDQHVVIARSGSEALREVLRKQFAVILMDVNMPGIDGLETARLIRGYRRSAHTPIIFVTAYADELQLAQGYSLGAVDYILSPVIPDVLRSKVRVFVDLFIMQQRLRQQALERIAIARAEAAQRAAEENTRRSIFLAQAGHELAHSLDADIAMRRLLALLVPRFAPRALLWLRDGGHGHERVLRCDAPTRPDEPPMFEEGREQMLSEALYNATRHALDPVAPSLDALATGEGPSPGVPPRRDTASGSVLPLVAGERVVGGLLLADPHPPTDWPTLEELAGRAAIAFENARLYGALQAEIVERRQIEAALLQASHRKDEFLAMLSHELRNPLAPIRNAVEVMRSLADARGSQDGPRTAEDGRLAEAVAVTDRQTKHLTRLVDELLDVARISQGKIVLKTALLDLRDIVRQGLEPVQSLIDAQRQQLRLTLPAQPARDLALDLVGQVAVLPAADVEVDVGLVQGHGHGLEVPRPADVGEHDPHPRVPRGDPVEQDRAGEVDPQSLAAGLARAEPAGAGVRQQREAELSGGVEEREEAVVARVERLHRRVQLQALQAELREAREPLQRVLSVGVDAPEPHEAPRLAADPRDLGVVELLAARVPPQQHTDQVEPLVERHQILDRVRLRARPEVALDRVRVMPDAPTHPVPGGQVHMHVHAPHPTKDKGA